MITKYRNLVIGCDGTWNDANDGDLSEGDAVPASNVVKLLLACLDNDYQETHYEEGVGTAFRESAPGGMWGHGLDRLILGAYRFLRKRYNDEAFDTSRNRIFVFGFSRGAYAARRLAGFVSECGVTSNPADDSEAWEAYKNRDSDKIRYLKENGKLFAVDIEMIGVWDTVKSTLDESFDDYDLPDRVSAAYHAMSIDEKRKFFPVLKWHQDRRISQIWFSGVHADIGGGYPERGLSDITLRWMIDKACGHGLRVKSHPMEELKDDSGGKAHDSFTSIWKPFGEYVRHIEPGEKIHQSVQERIQRVAQYRPANIPNSAKYIA